MLFRSGDQILNAKSFEAQGFSLVLEEQNMTKSTLLEKIHQLYSDKTSYIQAMNLSNQSNAIQIITQLIESIVNDA